uniref:ribosomal protein S3 n=1 Tax=Hydnora africana TaxID=50133 RepID=UPI0021144AFE|nr:ribosomal protein S3 [Hydnora africana]USN93607.1 ribosomal protein S3 [Hydnora africana]
MGTRVNPISHRLVINENYNSFWFFNKKNYSINLNEDEKLRNCITSFFNKIYKSTNIIESILIKRKINFIKIQIKVFTYLKLFQFNIRRRLRETISNFIKNKNIRIRITLLKIAKPYENSNFIIRYIEFQLKNKISFGKIFGKILFLVEKKTNIEGIQIKISGRLYGKERAFVKWTREGSLPLHTIKTNVNYCSKSIKTRCGILGLKVWIVIKK